MFYKAQKRTDYWSKIRRKAPKVPDITCPAIDDILNQLEKQIDKEFRHSKFKSIERKMEKLRKANEKLRESGVYWHDACKDAVRDLLGKKKTR
tara:strand:- start:2745 stop:3023 length:279 start_codon:yes stop_codon:yes gene_type:complete